LALFCTPETVDVVQSVRTSDCGSESRGFEPHLPPQNCKRQIFIREIYVETRNLRVSTFVIASLLLLSHLCFCYRVSAFVIASLLLLSHLCFCYRVSAFVIASLLLLSHLCFCYRISVLVIASLLLLYIFDLTRGFVFCISQQ
jgi:hypothetical protein